MHKFRSIQENNNGFTLVELMITVVIASFVMAVAYASFNSQKSTYVVQDQVVEMQQGVRAAMNIMAREIRMANYSPLNGTGGITTALPTQLIFSYEKNIAGTMRTIQYSFYDAYDDNDNDIGRKVDAGSIVPLAENIEALEFFYLDANNNPTATVSDIKTIQVSILARSSRSDLNFLNTFEYFPASCPQPAPPAAANYTRLDGTGIDNTAWDLNPGTANNIAPNDNVRRRLLITTISLRN